MSIPKLIHYCWFGPKQIPENEKQYIENWKRKLPDYRFVLWNEQNFDVNKIRYVEQAYENKKYAFVADYVRIYALNRYGGIYLDTDVELLKRFDKILNKNSFLGFENRTMVGTGIIGSIPHHSVFEKMEEYYNTHDFIDINGVMDTTTNVRILNKILQKEGLVAQNSEQNICGIHIFERSVLCPQKRSDYEFIVTKDTITIHHFDASWLSEREKKRGTSPVWRNVCRPTLKIVREMMEKILGEEKTKLFEAKLRDKMK